MLSHSCSARLSYQHECGIVSFGRGASWQLAGSKFLQRRKAVGFSQESLAEWLGVDRSTVARWEIGETEPLPWIRPKLARAVQVSIDQLDDLLTAEGSEALADERIRYALEHPRGVDLVAVAHLREGLEDLDMRYDRAPSTSLLAEAGEQLGKVSFRRTHAAAGRARRQLLSIEADAATLMGQLVWNASHRRDHVSARAYLGRP